MGLFNKKKDVIVGPSGYAYTAEEGQEDHSPRTSTDHRRSTESPRRSEDHSSSNRRSIGESSSTVAPIVGATGVGAAAQGHNRRESREITPVNDVSRSTQPPTQFTSGAVPASTTTTTTTPIAAGSTVGLEPRTSLSSGSHQHGSGVEGLKGKIIETAKAPHVHPNRERDAVLSEEDAKNAVHDHKYLQPVVHERVHKHHVEEIETHRTVIRHAHHVQHHIQPIIDEVHAEEVHLFREVPVTHIKENHAISPEDRALFDRLNIGESTTTIIPHDKVMVNKGETMRTEHIIHHVHHIVQPVWQRDLHEYFRLNPPNPTQPAPYSTSYTGPGSLGTAYYPQPNPASIDVQHGHASSVGGSAPLQGAGQVKEGHKLIPIEGSRREMHYVNREPVQAVQTGRTEVFPTTAEHGSKSHGGVLGALGGHSSHSHSQHGAAQQLPQTNTAPYTTTATAGAPVGQPYPTQQVPLTQAQHGMQNLNLGGTGVAK